MPIAKKATKDKDSASKASSTRSKGARLDILFCGPLLFIPSVTGGNVSEVEVYSPQNGHPMGAAFLPEVIFTNLELDDPECERWPATTSFSLLDAHSYSVELTQRDKKLRPFPAAGIPATNHKIKPGRKISSDWTVALGIQGRLSGWTSHRLLKVDDGMFGGSDAPTVPFVAGLQRLSFEAVTGAEFHGVSKEAKEYLRENISKGGTLIVQGEIPYQPSLLHQRRAVDSMARLAGLDLHLLAARPMGRRDQLMIHVGGTCDGAIMLVD